MTTVVGFHMFIYVLCICVWTLLFITALFYTYNNNNINHNRWKCQQYQIGKRLDHVLSTIRDLYLLFIVQRVSLML